MRIGYHKIMTPVSLFCMVTAYGLVGVLIGASCVSPKNQSSPPVQRITATNPFSPCLENPESEACVNEALSHPVRGQRGILDIAACFQPGVFAVGPISVNTPSRTAARGLCKESVLYSLLSEGLAEDCQHLHSYSERCVRLFDWDRDGVVTLADLDVWRCIMEDTSCVGEYVREQQ